MKPLLDGIRQTPEERRLRLAIGYLLSLEMLIETLPIGEYRDALKEAHRLHHECVLIAMRHPDNGGGGRD